MALKVKTMTHEEVQKQRLDQIEHDIVGAWKSMIMSLALIEDGKLWKHGDYESFSDYLNERWGWSVHKYHKNKTALKKNKMVEPFGLSFKNEYAARVFGGSEFEKWLFDGLLDDMEEAFEQKVKMLENEYADDLKIPITAKCVRALNEHIAMMINNGGSVYETNHGEVTPLDASLGSAIIDDYENTMEIIRHKSKYEYKRFTVTVGQPFSLDGFAIGEEVEISIKRLKEQAGE